MTSRSKIWHSKIKTRKWNIFRNKKVILCRKVRKHWYQTSHTSSHGYFKGKQKGLFLHNTHPWEYTLEMLIVPPSTVSSSCWLSCSLVVGHSADCASETDPWRGWESTPSLLTGTDMLACIAIGRGIPLLAKSGCLSAVLPTISWVGSWSIILWEPLSIVGEILTLFSSNFPGNGDTGPEPFFTIGGWPTKFWARQWLFLCKNYSR